MIKPGWIRGIEMLVKEEDLRKRIQKAQERNERVVKVVEKLKRAGIKSLKNKE